ncbi:MAG: ATP-binding protein [Chitinophagaceae bacterium]
MTISEYFKSIDATEIERYIFEGQEENVSIEFKTVNHPFYNDNNKEYDKKNLSEALSGFANSNGGIIIWGVSAKKNSKGQDVAHALTPIDELTKFLNFLNRNEGQAVIPILTGVIHEKIDTGNDRGFIKTLIPSSENAPHMAMYAKKHYYKRSGDSFYQCEHYDIVDMFSRKSSPKLELFTKILQRANAYTGDRYRYEILIIMRNTGKAMAKYPYLAIDCNHNYRPDDFGLDGNRNCGMLKVAKNDNFRFCYNGGNQIVLHPGATLDIDKYITEVNKSEFPENFNISYMISAENMETVHKKIIIDAQNIVVEAGTP